jgi:hypothetical protein
VYVSKRWVALQSFNNPVPHIETPIAIAGFDDDPRWWRLYYQAPDEKLVEKSASMVSKLDVKIPVGAGLATCAWVDDDHDERRVRVYYTEGGAVKQLPYNTSTKWVHQAGAPVDSSTKSEGILAGGSERAVAAFQTRTSSDQVSTAYVASGQNLGIMESASGGHSWTIRGQQGIYLR